MEILELLKRAKLHEWGDAPIVRAVPGSTPYFATTAVTLEFDRREDANEFVQFMLVFEKARKEREEADRSEVMGKHE